VRIEAGWRSASRDSEQQWYVTAEGHTLVVVPGPARFRMGTGRLEASGGLEPAPREELIRRSFSIASKETTVAQFQRFLLANPAIARPMSPPVGLAGEAPQLQVTWHQAVAYCNWLSENEGIPRDQWCFEPSAVNGNAGELVPAANWVNRRGYRLPSEAEWEYACRAGTETAWYFGNDPTVLEKYARGAGVADNIPLRVGMLKPNDFGLFDMLGNAAEWCMEEFSPRQISKSDVAVGSPVRGEIARVIRGGSYFDGSEALRTAARVGMRPNQPAMNVGFRVARSYP
jgi:formylglycine-generating enzyme required for sulfatase activity